MRTHLPGRFSFAAKVAGATTLIALADFMFFGTYGPIASVFALGWVVILITTVPASRKSRAPRLAIAASVAFGIILVDDPSSLAWTLFWIAVSMAAMLPRQRYDDAARWSQRLLLHALFGLTKPFRDARKFGRVRHKTARVGLRSVASMLALPLIGGSIFLALFAGANPLISGAIARLELPSLWQTILHFLVWVGVAVAVWPTLRPHPGALLLGDVRSDRRPLVPEVPLPTMTLSLIIFNAVFALQNGLDLIFLWSGAGLPATITLADYAHRGAYTLIATALLAGAFVLIALRPESTGARNPLVRSLLMLWVAQNLLLVASSILRLVDYIDAYSMTVLRLSAMAWMGLVAIGLVLICWRLLAARSAAWLINANALAAMLVLTIASAVDLGATAAAWNVTHARTEKDLDLCYLRNLGPSALMSLITLERRAVGARLQDRVAFIRQQTLSETIEAQESPRTWSWRNARRLKAATTAIGTMPRVSRPAPNGRDCDGNPILPPPIIEVPDGPTASATITPPSKPLTAEPKQ